MSVIEVGAVLGKGSRNVRFPGTTPVSEGTYEPQVLSFSPGIYLKLASTADNSGSGRDGVLGGTGGSFAAAALPSGTGTGNTAFDTQGTAFITIANAAADTARTNPTGSQWATLAEANPSATALSHLVGYRFVGAVEISIWFNPQTLPSGTDRAVIVSKSHTAAVSTSAAFAESHPIDATAGQTVRGGGFEAYFDANGAVHVEVRSFRGRLCRIRTPDGAVSTGNAYHLSVTMDYSGVTARLNGAQFENGIPNNLHVFGLSANIRGVIHNNSYDWMLGKAAWGGQADVILDEFAVYYRVHGSALSAANHNTLAQQSSTPTALGHYIWDRLTVNVTSYATIQAAIDDVNTSGGGTVQLNSTTYNQDFTLKSNVRLKGNGPSNTIINGVGRTPQPTIQTLSGVGTGDLAIGAQTLTISNSRAAEDIVVVRGLQGASVGSPAPAATRFDRRWSTEAQSANPQNGDADLFIIESRNGSSITFQGLGMTFALAEANRQEILAFTPNSWIALEGVRVVGPNGTSTSTRVVTFEQTRNFRVYNCDFRGDVTSLLRANTYCINGSISNISGQKSHVSGASGGETGFSVTNGGKDIVFSDVIITQQQRAFYDFTGSFTTAPAIRSEAHNTDDQSTIFSATFIIKFNAHEFAADSIIWNTKVIRGGYDLQSWKYDYRWGKFGTGFASLAGDGQISVDAGGADSYVRDMFHWEPTADRWFQATSEPVKRMRLENIERATSSVVNSAGSTYTEISYCNVDTPGTTGWTESC